MAAYSYVNGRYLPHSRAVTHIDDRGYLFSDGVYEVIKLQNGVLIDGDPHFTRLERSQKELDFSYPVPTFVFKNAIRELQRRNRCHSGYIYIQITRGTAPRMHHFSRELQPNVVITILRLPDVPETAYTKGIRVVSFPDKRWQRRDIKSISLLPNILAKQSAKEQHRAEAILVDEDGVVTEGSSTNMYMVQDDGTIVTHPANENILHGVTRATVIRLAKEAGMKVREVPFTLEAAKEAQEMFLTSTVQGPLPIIQIDDDLINGGHVGDVAKELRRLYLNYIEMAIITDEIDDVTC